MQDRLKGCAPRGRFPLKHRPLKLRPTQLRVKGAVLAEYPMEGGEPYRRYELNLQHGAAVPEEAVMLIREALLMDVITPLSLIGRGNWPALVKDLDERGYDLSTLELTVDMKQPGVHKADWIRKPRVPPQRAGVLDLRWGWVDYDHTPDLVCSWQRPCLKGDCNLLLSWLSVYRYDSLSSDLRTARPDQLRELLNAKGFDLRSFHMVIRRKPESDEADTASGMADETV